MVEESKKYTVAIDLGESNVVVVVGSINEKGLVVIEGIVSHPCEGVKSGMIDNIALVEASIRAAVTEIEESLNIRILEAYAGISGEFVRFACHSDHVYLSQPQGGVNHADVSALFDRMRHVQAPDNEIIMERIPQNYVVDDEKEVKNPVGSFGRRLSSTFNFILCGNTPMQRLENALKIVGIKMLKSFPNALSVADSVLSSDEKEEGVVVVDIGGGLTDVTIYYRNAVRYIATIPMGATSINHDIRSMMIPDKYIENLKRKYGSAVADLVPENKAVRVPGRTPRESRNIMLYNLAVAIEARVAMLIDFVKEEIKDSGYEDKLPYGIVITGGCANLANIEELFRRMTDMEVRIGMAVEGIDMESMELVENPEYATAVGILLRGMEYGGCNTGDNTPIDTTVVVEPKSSGGGYTPPKGKSEIYTLPVREPYSPPKQKPTTPPVVEEVTPPASKSDATESLSEVLRQESSQQEQQEPEVVEPASKAGEGGVESGDDFVNEPEKESQPKPRKIGGGISGFFKGVVDKINDGFNAAGEEEI